MSFAPPRRLHVKDADSVHFDCRALKIFVDGERMREVISYDVDEGYVVRFLLDDAGNPLVNRGEFLTETVRGRVMIELSNA